MSEKGKKPDPEKMAMIDGLPNPTNAKGVAKLLGHVGWYGEFNPNFSKTGVLITSLLGKDVRFP